MIRADAEGRKLLTGSYKIYSDRFKSGDKWRNDALKRVIRLHLDRKKPDQLALYRSALRVQ